jgi:hypothetical protein
MPHIKNKSWLKLQKWISPTGWFLAECVFDYRKDHKSEPFPGSVEERIILLKGKTLRHAVTSLKRIVKMGESIPLVCGYEHFVGATNIVPVYDALENGCELLTRTGKQCIDPAKRRVLVSRRRIMNSKGNGASVQKLDR